MKGLRRLHWVWYRVPVARKTRQVPDLQTAVGAWRGAAARYMRGGHNMQEKGKGKGNGKGKGRLGR